MFQPPMPPSYAEASLSALFRNCSTSFSNLISYLRLSSIPDCDMSSIEDDFGRLRAWASTTGANQEGPDSIDYQLQHSHDIAKSVSVLLTDITNSAKEIHRIGVDPFRIPLRNQALTKNRSSSGISSSGDSIGEIITKEADYGTAFVPIPQSEVQQHSSNIREAVNNLYTLTQTIQNPAQENRFLKTQTKMIDRSQFEVRDIEHIQTMFSNGERSLIEKLGKANTKRRQIFDYLETRHKDSQKTVPGSMSSSEVVLPLIASQERSTSPTAALQITMLADDSRSVQIPPLPAGNSACVFVCPYCYESTTSNTDALWEKHIYQDLQAYICTHINCRTRIQFFNNRDDWQQHELQHYTKSFTCILCKENYSTEAAFQDHLTIYHHVLSDRLSILIELCQNTRAETNTPYCPLCFKTIQDYKSHMGEHLESAALVVLPKQIAPSSTRQTYGSTSENRHEVVNPILPSSESSLTRGGGKRESLRSLYPSKRREVKESQQYVTGPEDPGLSFIFIVNTLEVNEDLSSGGVTPSYENGRWVPPLFPQGFYRQSPGDIFRWDNGSITQSNDYCWRDTYIGPDIDNEAAGGIVIDPNSSPLTRYSAATVFYSNPFIKFRATPGDASARSLYENGEIWHHLRFSHAPGNISIVNYAGNEDYLAGNADCAPWSRQVVPQAYNCQDENPGETGGLAGDLPLLIALMAFSCSRNELRRVFTSDQCWRNRNWVPHGLRSGRREGRGMVVTVYLDPENSAGSTWSNLRQFENIDGDSLRPILRPGILH